ncbi:MAG: hypothetical protein DLM69_04630 [Candidatus Chloroheliales bacterium]|nr:MAG: hypothetical protein DLM69_04630 [Chloroflexota bacterium]
MFSLTSDFITAKQVRQKLSETLDRVEEGSPVIITRAGLPAAVMISVEQYEEMQQAMEARYHIMMADAAQERADRGEAISGEEFIAELRANFGGAVDFETADLSEYVDVGNETLTAELEDN